MVDYSKWKDIEVGFFFNTGTFEMSKSFIFVLKFAAANLKFLKVVTVVILV